MDFDKLIADVQSVIAEKHPLSKLDRVIGYGSFWYGGHVEGQSDIDIAVVVTHAGLKPITTSTWDIDISISARLNDDYAIHVMRLDDLERHRKLSHTMKGKLLAQGEVLYANPNTRRRRAALQAKFSRIPYAEAKREYVTELRMRAAKLIQPVGVATKTDIVDFLASNAQVAAVFSLWSVLYENDLDASPKAIRWHAGRLATIASMFRPELAEIIPVAELIPSVHLRDQIERHSDDEYEAIIAAGKQVALAVLGDVGT